MTTTLATAPGQACGCGEDQIPGLLAKLGLFGTVGLALAVLVLMILAGWLLSTTVWLFRRRSERARGPAAVATPVEPSPGPLAGFSWTSEDP
ncbi:hypothetical protein OG252_20395 [Streptomyces sp. NBC_01352]|uniref:hypothetical protein n=1 Tax=unclassified Streptomyces TaxID=2593676 RepID=UPI002251CF09|nr:MULTISPECIES: hypothetical protein [unclassified Streptomyces]MCX4698342.1 hypothetical protein [Streptomyces sp. NBC_01373]